jgi:dTMP kinase
MKVKIKRVDKTLPLPQYESSGAVAFDFVARQDVEIFARNMARIPSNIVVEIPSGYMLLIKDRSSTLKKKGLIITAGVVDQDYCGDEDEILLQFYNPSDLRVQVKRGEKLAQGIFLPIEKAEWEEVQEMKNKTRGGFGSTDFKKESNPVVIPVRHESKTMNALKGKLIVIEGIDGSGKGTQIELLLNRLLGKGFNASKSDFPKYGSKSAGLVENYLNGEYGSLEEVNPYVASLFYALDRFDSKKDLEERLKKGEIIVSNRYVASNMGHQGSKFQNRETRQNYFAWLDNYEHNVFGIPRPDLNIILHVPHQIAQSLVAKKMGRDYIKGKTHDLHEADINHLKKAEETYLEMCDMFSNFLLIECAPKGEILPIETIHELIWNKVAEVL